MRHWCAALSDHYPDLLRALAEADQAVGNREVDVLEVLGATTDEGDRVRAVLAGCLQDIAATLLEAGALPAEATLGPEVGTRVFGALLGAFETGVWLGEHRLASMRPAYARARLGEIDRVRRQRSNIRIVEE